MISNEHDEPQRHDTKRRKPRARKVFVLVGSWDYEGSNVVGVYSTKRRAEKAKDHCVGNRGSHMGRCTHDQHDIEIFKVDA